MFAVDVTYDGSIWYPISQGYPTEGLATIMLEREKERYPASTYRIREYEPPDEANNDGARNSQ